MSTINFEPLATSNITLLFEWFMQPHVATWWAEPKDFALFDKKWLNRITTGYTEEHNPFNGYTILIDDTPIGYIQYYCVTAKDRIGYPPLPEHTVGLDLFIGATEYLGKKLSVPIITHFIETIIKHREPHTTMLIIDPAPNNQRAIHVYKKVGFKEIGTFKRTFGTVLLMYKTVPLI